MWVVMHIGILYYNYLLIPLFVHHELSIAIGQKWTLNKWYFLQLYILTIFIISSVKMIVLLGHHL